MDFPVMSMGSFDAPIELILAVKSFGVFPTTGVTLSNSQIDGQSMGTIQALGGSGFQGLKINNLTDNENWEVTGLLMFSQSFSPPATDDHMITSLRMVVPEPVGTLLVIVGLLILLSLRPRPY
jgi:hypothetical protein